MLVDQFGRTITTSDLFLDAANKAVIGPGANVYSAGGVSIAGMNPRSYMEQAQQLYYQNPWIRTAEGLVSKKLATAPWRIDIHTEADDEEQVVSSGPAWDFLDIGSPLQGLSRSKLWQITSRHMGLCNNAFWYPDFKMPENGSIYVNPARVTPHANAAGYLSYWVVDEDEYDDTKGTRFEKDELLWFQLEAADVGFFGHGLVYSALIKATLNMAADRHALQVLESGGRLQGILTPVKDEYLGDAQFASMQRELRNVTELDDSAKRMVLLRKAVEFKPTTMKPDELRLVDLMRTTKEDIYEIWGVPRSQTGGMTEVGMNSGDRQSYEEAALQQNAIHPRIVVFEETIRLLLKKFDPRYELEIEEPEFDDERPLYEMLKMSEFAPMSNDERRKLIKLPPLKNKTVGSIVSQNPSLLQVDPAMPIARSMITGRLQDGSTVEPAGTPQDVQQHVDAINVARGAPKQVVGKAEIEEMGRAVSEYIAAHITEKADHFLAKPYDFDMIASQKGIASVVGSKEKAADMLREIHAGLKAIVDTGRANDWAVEEYAEAVRGADLVSDHLAHSASVASVFSPSPSTKSDDGTVTVTLPRVNVQPAQVHVPAADMAPVAKAVSDLGDMLMAAMPKPVEPVPVQTLRRLVERDKDGRIVAIVDTLA